MSKHSNDKVNEDKFHYAINIMNSNDCKFITIIFKFWHIVSLKFFQKLTFETLLWIFMAGRRHKKLPT